MCLSDDEVNILFQANTQRLVADMFRVKPIGEVILDFETLYRLKALAYIYMCVCVRI